RLLLPRDVQARALVLEAALDGGRHRAELDLEVRDADHAGRRLDARGVGIDHPHRGAAVADEDLHPRGEALAGEGEVVAAVLPAVRGLDRVDRERAGGRLDARAPAAQRARGAGVAAGAAVGLVRGEVGAGRAAELLGALAHDRAGAARRAG